MEKIFTSTRSNSISVSAKEAIKQGLAADHGLFVDPDLAAKQVNLAKILSLDYQKIAKTILTKLLPEFSPFEVGKSIDAAYNRENFTSAEITPVKFLGSFYALELFHGPTSAFKDIGLQLLPYLMLCALDPGERSLILTATSGDTGKAALEGFKDVKDVGIIVFYPEKGVSPTQKQQMVTTTGANTKVVGIKGNFDDAQTNVKNIFSSQKLKEAFGANFHLSSANSINIGRLIPQIVYYFSAYKQLLDQGMVKMGNSVNFTVPTGNFGDVLGGYYAKLLGLPVKKLIVACNENNVLVDFFNHGIYDRNRPFFKTAAPSMDIQVSSNLERLLYYKSNKNTQFVKSLMDQLESLGKYEIPDDLLHSIQTDFYCGYSTDDDIKKSIHEVYTKKGYVMDPHTAAGYKVMKDYQRTDRTTPMILLSTASPLKFANTVAQAIGLKKTNSVDPARIVEELAVQANIPVPANLRKIWNLLVKHRTVLSKEEMESYVAQEAEEIFYDKDQGTSY